MPFLDLCTKYKKKPFFFFGILRDYFENPCAEGSIDGAIPPSGSCIHNSWFRSMKKHENAGYMQKIPKKISSLLESVTVIDGAITHDNFDSNACKGL